MQAAATQRPAAPSPHAVAAAAGRSAVILLLLHAACAHQVLNLVWARGCKGKVIKIQRKLQSLICVLLIILWLLLQLLPHHIPLQEAGALALPYELPSPTNRVRGELAGVSFSPSTLPPSRWASRHQRRLLFAHRCSEKKNCPQNSRTYCRRSWHDSTYTKAFDLAGETPHSPTPANKQKERGATTPPF